MSTERLLIVGAGGHAKVVADAWLSGARGRQLRVTDESPAAIGQDFAGCIVEDMGALRVQHWPLHLAIGSAAVRETLHQRFALQETLQTVIAPGAHIAANASIGAGSFIANGAVVSADALVGRSSIINHTAVVDHDCRVGDFSHIAPGAVLGGAVQVGRCSLVGAGAVVLPGVVIGDYAIVGAGATVTRDVAGGDQVTGTPARTHGND